MGSLKRVAGTIMVSGVRLVADLLRPSSFSFP
jgi:hypothetical protein